MKIQGVHHVSTVVQNMERAIEFFSGICDMEFREAQGTSEQLGFRICISDNGLIELLQVADPVKAANSPSPFKEMAEFAARGGEGPYRLHMIVADADQAAADAEKNGFPTAYIQEGGGAGGPVSFKKINFSEKDEITRRFTLMSEKPNG